MAKSHYEVIVGNIGRVRTGNFRIALNAFNEYVSQSVSNIGRAAGESVVIMQDGEPVREHIGSLDQEQSNG